MVTASLQINTGTKCYEIREEGTEYIVYRILAYDVETKAAYRSEILQEHHYISKALAIRKRNALEKELAHLNTYGFSWYGDVR